MAERVDARHLHESDDRHGSRITWISRSKASSRRSAEPFHVPSTLAYWTCGALQAAFYAAYALFGLWVLDTGYRWATAATSALEIYARGVVFAAGSLRRRSRRSRS